MKRVIEEFITILSIETGEDWGKLMDSFESWVDGKDEYQTMEDIMWDFVVDVHDRELTFQDDNRWKPLEHYRHDIESAYRMRQLHEYFQKNGYSGLIQVLTYMDVERKRACKKESA